MKRQRPNRRQSPQFADLHRSCASPPGSHERRHPGLAHADLPLLSPAAAPRRRGPAPRDRPPIRPVRPARPYPRSPVAAEARVFLHHGTAGTNAARQFGL